MGYDKAKDIVYQNSGTSALTPHTLPELAAELVEWHPDVIVTGDTAATRAALTATSSIPIVAVTMVDPVKAGLVDGIARPGGNITGIVLPNAQLIGKKLELLKELAPELERVGVIFNPSSEHGATVWQEAQSIAARHGLGLEPLEFDTMSEVVPALTKALAANAKAFLVLQDRAAYQHAREINDFAIQRGLPVVYPNSNFIEYSYEGLISFGPDLLEIRSKVASLVDRILQGANPAELPMRQVTQIALVLGRDVAEKMGMEIPQSILARTTRVIDHQINKEGVSR
jgi:putative ABC transport system substrate-binding protein